VKFIDVVLILIPIIGFIRGLMKGFLHTLATFGGFATGLFLGFSFYKQLAKYLVSNYGLADTEITNSLSLIALFIAPILVFRLIERALKRTLNWLSLGYFNYILGGFAGLIKYAGLFLILIYLMAKIPVPFIQNQLSELEHTSFVFAFYADITRLLS
jgi:membrane protein required for colicin V production